MSDKLWAGRFSKTTDSGVNDFNSSVSFDCRMYKEDIAGSIAHANMLGETGVIHKDEADKIVVELNSILKDLDSGSLEIDPTAEDIHMFVEAELTRRIGEAGKRLHTARSRNDQVALDLRCYMRGQIENIILQIHSLISVLIDTAGQHTDTVMPGYTHLQRAQPITFAHHVLAYCQMLERDMQRLSDCKERLNFSPLGAGALAGTTYPIDRNMTAQKLGFDGICENSLDAVSDRDFCLEFAACASIIMVHLSRFCEEIILWCSWEFQFIELDDGFATGSSIMPQKKNPDVAELIRGKSGRVFGALTTLLTMMKGLPLAYNKDMQEDKQAVFDIIDTLKLCLTTLAPMIATMTVNKDKMLEKAKQGFLNATDCADYLVKKGLPFRDAYKITGEIVAECIQKKLTIEQLELASLKARSPLFEQDFYAAVDLLNCVNGRGVAGGPAKSAVLIQIEKLQNRLSERYEIPHD